MDRSLPACLTVRTEVATAGIVATAVMIEPPPASTPPTNGIPTHHGCNGKLAVLCQVPAASSGTEQSDTRSRPASPVERQHSALCKGQLPLQTKSG
jgi:hypothetical protein